MKSYARVDNGIVQEIISPMAYEFDDSTAPPAYKAGDDVPIQYRFTPDLVAQMVDVTSIDPQPQFGWTYGGGIFSAPVPYQPSADEIKVANTSIRDLLLAQATLAIAPLQDAVDLSVATATDTALLTQWKQYRVGVNRVDLTVLQPAWPLAPVT